jgi:hypothetical protein
MTDCNVFLICEHTGLRIFEPYPYLQVREDGMVRNTYGFHSSIKNWKYGTKDKKRGYFSVGIPLQNRSITVHRLVAISFIYREEWQDQVDHIDGNRGNNDLSNLRWCDCHGNHLNMVTHRNGQLVGTHRSKITGRWSSKVWSSKHKKTKHLGYYDSMEEAHAVYIRNYSVIE